MQKVNIRASNARLVPAKEKVCTGRDLARILVNTKLSDKELAAWHSDLIAARKALQVPKVIEPK